MQVWLVSHVGFNGDDGCLAHMNILDLRGQSGKCLRKPDGLWKGKHANDLWGMMPRTVS
jgi:hypothetical protein